MTNVLQERSDKSYKEQEDILTFQLFLHNLKKKFLTVPDSTEYL